MAGNTKGEKASDLDPKAVKSADAASVRGGATITGSEASVKTIRWIDPPEPELTQRSPLNKV